MDCSIHWLRLNEIVWNEKAKYTYCINVSYILEKKNSPLLPVTFVE